jgi:23S rRNA (adenine2503-C2)-methyltransferase
MSRVNLKEMKPDELSGFIRSLGLPAFRARQLLHWIYGKKAGAIEEITEYSMQLRSRLEGLAFISNLMLLERLVSSDGTEKYLFGLEDGEAVESVSIPEEGRLTLCVSSQAGCAMGCAFCRTGIDGLRRNLKAYEIADQVIAASRLVAPRRLTNVVLMGMGEPLHNVDEVADALWRIAGPMEISRRRITLSTAGLAPGIDELPRKAPPVKLAVSLNAATDDVRDRIMPVNRRYPLKELLDACRRFPLDKRSRITFEYVMLEGLNDSTQDARRLVAMLRGIPAKVNLIPFNEFEGCAFRAPGDSKVLSFQSVLLDSGLTAIIRKSRGQDIMASCGQLSGSRRAGRAAARQ